GRGLESQGRVGEALKAYQAALQRDSSRADVHQRMAVAFDRQGDPQRAKHHYQEALKLDPGNPDIFCDMGYSMYLQKQWSSAEMNFRQAVRLDDDHERANNNLGLVLAHTDRVGESLAAFRKGGCDESESHVNVALVKAVQGDLDESRRHYQLALSVNPQMKSAQEALAKLDKVENKLAKRPSNTVAAAPARPAAKSVMRQVSARKPTVVARPVRLPPTSAQSPVVRRSPQPSVHQAQPESSLAARSVAPDARPVAASRDSGSVMAIPSEVSNPAPYGARPTSQSQWAPTASRQLPPSTPAPRPAAEVQEPSLEIAPGALQRDRYSNETVGVGA
ncbi:MAG: tetratricopeptide repeat protein, partial [Planctomycetales bacterium]